MAVYKTQVTADQTVELTNVLSHFPAWDVMVTSMTFDGAQYVLTLSRDLTEEEREHLNMEQVL